MKPNEKKIRAALLRMAADRGPKTFCPSEVARELSDDWRPLMPAIRTEAQLLVDEGQLRCSQKGKPASPIAARGPIRLSKA